MESNQQTIDTMERCELCAQKMNPTVKIYKQNTRLCSACYGHLECVPEVVAQSIERFLIGNVV